MVLRSNVYEVPIGTRATASTKTLQPATHLDIRGAENAKVVWVRCS
jgi:hypothetical protein